MLGGSIKNPNLDEDCLWNVPLKLEEHGFQGKHIRS